MHKNGLFWENENFIKKNCPNLLMLYEENQRKQQQLLVRF